MIIRKKENWFRMLFIWHGSVLPALLPRLLILFALSLLVAYFHGTVFSFKIPLNTAPLTLFGFVLALFWDSVIMLATSVSGKVENSGVLY